MKRANTPRLALALAIVALPTASFFGCGSSGGEDTSGPLSKAQFLHEGDRICKKRLEEKDAAIKAGLKELAPSELAKPSSQVKKDLGESIIPPAKGLTEELSDLPAPVGSKAEVEEIVAKLKTGLKKAESDPASLLDTDPFADAAVAARAYGFKRCNL
jgi:hypothetical protein